MKRGRGGKLFSRTQRHDSVLHIKKKSSQERCMSFYSTFIKGGSSPAMIHCFPPLVNQAHRVLQSQLPWKANCRKGEKCMIKCNITYYPGPACKQQATITAIGVFDILTRFGERRYPWWYPASRGASDRLRWTLVTYFSGVMRAPGHSVALSWSRMHILWDSK